MFGDGQVRQLRHPVSQRLSKTEPMMHEKCIQQLQRLTIMQQNLTAAVERYANQNKAMEAKLTIKYDEIPERAELGDLAAIHPEIERLKLDNYKLSEQLKQDFYRPDNYFRGAGRALKSAEDQKKDETVKMLKKQLEIIRTQCLKIAAKGGNTLEIEKYERMQRENTALKQFLRQRMGRGRAGPIPNHIRRIIGNRAEPALDYTKVVAPQVTNMEKMNRQLQRQIEQLNQQQKLLMYRMQILQANHLQSQEFNVQLKSELSQLTNRQTLHAQLQITQPLVAQVKALEYDCARLRERLALQHVQQNQINHQLNVAAQMAEVQNDIQVSKSIALQRQKAMEQQLYRQKMMQQQQLQAFQQEVQTNHLARQMDHMEQMQEIQQVSAAHRLRQTEQMRQIWQSQQAQQMREIEQIRQARQQIPLTTMQTEEIIQPILPYTDSATFVEQVPTFGGMPLLVNELAAQRTIEEARRRQASQAMAYANMQRQAEIQRQQEQSIRVQQQTAAQQMLAREQLVQQQLAAQQQIAVQQQLVAREQLAAQQQMAARQQYISQQQMLAREQLAVQQMATRQQLGAQQQIAAQQQLTAQQLATQQHLLMQQQAVNNFIAQQQRSMISNESAALQRQQIIAYQALNQRQIAAQRSIAQQQAAAQNAINQQTSNNLARTVTTQHNAQQIQHTIPQQTVIASTTVHQQTIPIQNQQIQQTGQQRRQPIRGGPARTDSLNSDVSLIHRVVERHDSQLSRQTQNQRMLRVRPDQPEQNRIPNGQNTTQRTVLGQVPVGQPRPIEQQHPNQPMNQQINSQVPVLPLRVQNNNRPVNLTDMFD